MIGLQKKQGSIVDVLKQEILAGNIPSGTEMTQVELAQSLGVSRMPVREALMILEYSGLVERLPNNHVRVADFSDTFLDEVFSLCVLMEEKALQRLSAEEIGEIRKKMEESPLRRLYESGESEELRLHRRLCAGITNPFFQKTLSTLIEVYVDYALSLNAHQQETRTALFLDALSAPDGDYRSRLTEYFRHLKCSIEEKRRGCGC